MNNSLLKHPTEEALIEHVLAAGKEDIQEHAHLCEECSEAISDFQEIKEAFISMPEEEIPASLRQHILKDSNNLSKQLNILSAVQLFRSPFLVGIGVIALVLFLYFLFVFMV